MFYTLQGTTSDFKKFVLGDVCNFQLSNLDLANSVDISSNGEFVDIGKVFPNQVLILDQNNFSFSEVYIRSSVPGAPANYQMWGW
jgi:hypothetical protein